MLDHPASAGELDAHEAGDAPAIDAARLVARILEVERLADWKRLMTLRDQFRLLNVDLFALYMARREVRHWR